jgi:hypothetical protein
MVRVLHDGACWLLSAVLLLTNGLPVAIQHAHDVGDQPYHHSHHTGHVPTSTLCDPDAAVASVTEHVHMLWFGWELTIVPPKGSRPVPCPSLTAGGILTQVVAKGGGHADGELTQFAQIVIPGFQQPTGCSPVATGLSIECRPLAALPLCDTARHLRSGVQLI